MMIAYPYSIVVPAGQTVTADVPVYCLASDLDAPDTESTYSTCDTVNNDCLNAIVSILETKNLEALSYSQCAKIQDINWACTEGKTVDYAYLNSLPSLK